jgi:hypothetical protein
MFSPMTPDLFGRLTPFREEALRRGLPLRDGREGSTLHWVIPRQDLAERRFDRAHVSFFWNP